MGEVAFTDLNPRCTQAPGCAICLTFDCPVCGPPYTVDVPIILNGAGEHLQPNRPKWTASTPDVSWDHLTITPSIDNTPGGHGRKKPCTFHGNITNGRVAFP